MECDCIKDIETRLADYLKPKAGEDARAKCLATGLQLDESLGLRLVLNIPFRINGNKKGFTSQKGKEMPVVASYCPFCGRSTKHYQVGVDAGIEAAMNPSRLGQPNAETRDIGGAT